MGSLASGNDRLSVGSYGSCIPETPSPPAINRGAAPDVCPEADAAASVPPVVEALPSGAVTAAGSTLGTPPSESTGAAEQIACAAGRSHARWLRHCPITGLPITEKLMRKLKAAPQVTVSTLRNALQNTLGWTPDEISEDWDKQALIVVGLARTRDALAARRALQHGMADGS